ncbi:ribonuclease HI family protein [Patescibacteria group bacterium]|nr:ribonuclease HI family protein [Patescibacteria group bacterium]
MVKLPASIDRKLKELFPRVRERDKFVADILTEALEKAAPEEVSESVGGTLHLFTDGGSRGNPGQSAIGIIIEDPTEGKVVREHAERIGIETNNIAEYRALIEGLKIAKRYHPNRLVCFLDSELIVKQLKGEYRVKMPALKEFFAEIQELVTEFTSVEFHHIPRADNYRADALVNKALDEHPSPSYEKL